MRKTYLFLLPLLLLAVSFTPLSAVAQFTLLSIEPSAPVNNTRPPRIPQELMVFRFSGTLGTTYTAQFSAGFQPAVVIGIGVEILSSGFDESSRIYSVNFTKNTAIKTNAGDAAFAPEEFFLVFDQGLQRDFQPQPRPSAGIPPPGATAPAPTPRPLPTAPPTRTAVPTPTLRSESPPPTRTPDQATPAPGGTLPPTATPRATLPPGSRPGSPAPRSFEVRATEGECRGPGSFQVSGLTTIKAISSGPPPLEARGTEMSTDIYDWCVIPPSEESPYFGFGLSAPSGQSGFFRKKLSPGLVTLISTLAGKELQAENLAIYNGTFQASKSISRTDDGGALIRISVQFKTTSTKVSGIVDTTSAALTTTAATATVTKTILTSEQESLSLAPAETTVTTKRSNLYGFTATDLSLAGQTVKIQKKSGSKYTTVASTKVASDGSYSLNVTTTKLFGVKKNVTLVSTIISDQIRQSREISLSNRFRSSRR